MQRDAYYALLYNRHRRKVPVSILQMNGKVFRQNLIEDFFTSYAFRRLALMTHTAGQDPRLPRLPKDIVVPDYKTFLRIHQPHFMYRLLPLLCTDVEAFAAMQAICESPGSPFTMTDRIDCQHLNYHFTKLGVDRERICEFLKDYTRPTELLQPTATRSLPIQGVVFHGVLLHEGLAMLNTPVVAPAAAAAPAPAVHVPAVVVADAAAAPTSSSGTDGLSEVPRGPTAKPKTRVSVALVTTHNSLHDQAITQRSLMTQFFRSEAYLHHGSIVMGAEVQSIQQQMHVMAVKRITTCRGNGAENRRYRRHLLERAARENLYVYEKVAEGEYIYAAP